MTITISAKALELKEVAHHFVHYVIASLSHVIILIHLTLYIW